MSLDKKTARRLRGEKYGIKLQEKFIMSFLREYVYIDDIEINSVLAQINEGLNQRTTRAQKHEELNGIRHSQSAKVGVEGKGKVPFVAEGGANTEAKAKRESEHSNNDSTEDLVESVYNDYGVEVLENELKEQDLLRQSGEELRYGDFITLTQPFTIVDFSMIETITNPELLKETMSQGSNISELQSLQTRIAKQEKKSRNNMDSQEKDLLVQRKGQLKEMEENIQQGEEISHNAKSVYEFGKLGNALFNNSVLIRGHNFNAYGERNHFRFDKIQLSMLQNNHREGTIVGIIENKAQFVDDPFSSEKTIGSDMAKIDTFFLNNILSNFNLLNDNDLLIKPLALYFE